MKFGPASESGRSIDVIKSAKFVADNIETLVLRFLRGSESMSKHEIIHAILNSQGVTVNPNRMDMLLESLKKRGLVEEIKRGLLTAYTLTDEGREVAGQARTNGFATFL